MKNRWMWFSLLLAFCCVSAMSAFKAADVVALTTELHAPAGNRPTQIVRSANSALPTVIPNGRLITPAGVQVTVAPHPYGLALSPDGKTLVTVNSGTAPFSISIITRLGSSNPSVVKIPQGFKPTADEPKSVYVGIAIASDNRTAYVSEGDNGRIGVFDLVQRERLSELNLDGRFEGTTCRNSLTGDLKLSPDGHTLYALDLAHFRLVVFDVSSRRMIASLPVGYLPFGIALSPDGRTAYVSNAGMFRYSLVPGYNPKRPKKTGLTFPPFGFPSPEAERGVTVEGKAIPGLGSPNTLFSNSVWAVDVSNPARPAVWFKVRTGIPIGPGSVGGSSPCGIVVGGERVYISNASQDSITVLDAADGHLLQTILLEPAESVKGLRGILPFGLALSPNRRVLYVACAGINAVAVMNAETGVVLGYIPTGWFPSRVAVSSIGRTLYVANGKGFGAGPNGGPDFHPGPEGSYIGNITKGTVSIIDLMRFVTHGATNAATIVAPSNPLRRATRQVLANNGFIRPEDETSRSPDFPIPPPDIASHKISHVIFIVKENRTFDQVFGDLEQVNGQKVDGEADLAEFGNHACAQNKKLHLSVTDVRVSPNEHALAARFGVSDNFYVDSDVSVDGHHWLVGNYPNEVLETAWPAGYGGEFSFKPDNQTPGRLEIGSTSPWPEDFLEAGSLWEHLDRYHVSFRNYGENLEVPGYVEDADTEPTGVRESVNVPMPEALFENTSRIYPDFNTNISDQYRYQQFLKEFKSLYVSGEKPLPQFIYIWLPQDHTAKPNPRLGYDYRASYVADNDLALGKLIDLFSHSRWWNNMAIFVTEDDAQAGTDHVDAHRSVLLVISPYSRRGVSRDHTSFMSILKTFDLIFGIPYLNQYDAAATDLSGSFTATPDFTPYQAIPSDTRVFDPARVVEKGLETASNAPSADLDDPDEISATMQEKSNQPALAGCPR
ncbi:MAG TPA: bifunctional YncE family protein/alkaline phosphatase family protein [Terriglobia bacterium]|nr:bifunctional YncE family protein/alkaline phosphatase family protein [Terriglobia bacterium]